MNDSLKSVLIVFAGSGAGGAARYGMHKWMARLLPSVFPFGTFTVNIIGCFVIGLFYALSEKGNLLSPDWRLALTTGLCGGFTTFSAFSYENMNLLKTGNYWYFVLYTTASVVLGIAAVFGGIFITRYIL